jgi:hypothetical protein
VLDGHFCNYCDGSFTFPKDIYNPNDPTTFPTNYMQRISSTQYHIPNISPTDKGKTVYNVGAGIFKDKITLNQWLIIVLNVINAPGH